MERIEVNQLTPEQAVEFYEKGEWKNWTLKEIALFQLHQQFLCVPFPLFHEAIEALLERSVWTHEMADSKALIDEYEGKIEKPTINDVVIKLFRMVDKDEVDEQK
jgi:hypothetical protein